MDLLDPRFRHHDSHTLKCAAVFASVKDDTSFEKVPLSAKLEGSPLLAADGTTVFGSNAICRLVLSKQALAKQGGKEVEQVVPFRETLRSHGLHIPLLTCCACLAQNTTQIIGPDHAADGKFVEEWLEAAENALERAGLKWFSELVPSSSPLVSWSAKMG